MTSIDNWLSNAVSWFTSDWQSFATCLVIGWVTYKCARFYYRVWSLPRGPFPWPLVGNLLSLRGRKCNNIVTFSEMAKVYGPVFTFWIGPMPMVAVYDLELTKELFKKWEFTGRPIVTAMEMLKEKMKASTINMDQYGPRWETTRKVAHAAVRKYAVSEQLPLLVSEVVDEVVKKMIEKEGSDKLFNPEDYIQAIYYITLATMTFGKRFSQNDPEIIKLRQFRDNVGDWRFFILELMPFLRPFSKKFFDRFNNFWIELVEIIKQKFDEHLKDFDENHIRDFCDILLLAKQEAIAEAKESAQYLTNDNLGLATFDLFLAGSEPTQTTTKWLLLYLANFPEHQQKLREEIASIIGDRMPVQDDIKECHQVNAFIHEVMRIRPVTPTFPHTTMVNAKIGDYTIPRGTMVVSNIYAIHHNPEYFPEPDRFKPERFLDSSDRFSSQKPMGFIPFNVGRRFCIGDRLALANVFLVVANLLQKTSGYEFALKNGAGSGDLEMNPSKETICEPKKFEIKLKRNI